ncbi:hypothetical protein QUB80_10100 [Chlorogloeopsis sp. ULAP01]|uniref:hypothetical protein n=1 Tax=Chlorogloeopsis sp. ULAP01 TaxID=3056483 RepID=UPI0025AAB90F|nr:hypothetical protein [Chlorogloeopsis sp. ULAP01]MDM9381055.1 hypothetical protein [Chlorogloeopsis sp. ULAP01]
MLSSSTLKKLVIRESKIVHKSPVINPLARFVTEEAVALMFKIKFEDIYVVECWRYVVYVHAKGVSKFVSYADFPPIVGVKPPTSAEIAKWRRRWRKHPDPARKRQAPNWWVDFFSCEFWQALSKARLSNWSELVGLIKFAFNEETLWELQQIYCEDLLMVSGK